MKAIYSHKCDECGGYTFDYHEGSHKTGFNYRWVCDECGAQMDIEFSDSGRSISQVPTGERCERTKILVNIPDLGIAIISSGVTWGGDSNYYYEESTCPSNVLRSCEQVVFNGEEDPHGIFELIDEVMITGENKIDEQKAVELLTTKAIEITSKYKTELTMT